MAEIIFIIFRRCHSEQFNWCFPVFTAGEICEKVICLGLKQGVNDE
jgi:hypothetical protein